MRISIRFIRSTCAAVALVLAAGSAFAQELPLPLEMPLPGVASYDAAVPAPEAIIGHQIGTRHTEPHQVVQYFEAVAALSDRVVLREHARSYEGRPLIHAVVTSAANHARLAEIKAANRRLSDAPGTVSDADIAAMPAVVYMGYSVHGNEASGTEAGVLLLYHLAAGRGESVESVLENTVVILDPMLNPDGRGRFTTWANRYRGAVPVADPQHREQSEAWPGGRTNHYFFDLNRDWLPVQHPESQGRIATFHDWRPQVLTDFHEMGGEATYFFQPGIPSRNNPNTPARTFELTEAIAGYHAQALDRIGSLYYAKESFDDFYYGKGSTYPDVNGAVGILFEQASSRALLRETSTGVLSYAFTVRNQFATSLSTLEAAVALRRDLLSHQRDFYAGASDFARGTGLGGYVIGTKDAPHRAAALAQILRQHRVEMHTLARSVTAEGETFQAGEALVIPLDQPQARFIHGAFDRLTTFTDSLFYDVSAWSLPLAFDLRSAEVSRSAFNANLLGARVTSAEYGEGFSAGSVEGGTARYAYAMPWDRYFAPRALYRLQAAGFYPRLATEPFTALSDGRVVAFERGTVIIPLQTRESGLANAAAVHAAVREAAAQDHVRIVALDGGYTPEGPDLGSRGGGVLAKPSVAILSGEGTSSNGAGEVWHLLDQRFRIPAVLLDAGRLSRYDLSRYTTIILNGGAYGDLDVDALKSWIRGGGTFLALGSGADWAVRNELLNLEARKDSTDFSAFSYADLSNARGAQAVGGAIVQADLDTTHPLAYGMRETMPLFRRGSAFYDLPETPGSIVARHTDAPLLAGYLSEERAAQAAGSAALVTQRHGRGHVIGYLDAPTFRAFWYGSDRLLLNGIFFGQAF